MESMFCFVDIQFLFQVFWPSGLFLFTFENWIPLMRLVVWYLSLPFMNSFNKKPNLLLFIFCLAQDVFPESFSLFSVEFNLLQLMFSACVAAVKCRPVLHQCVVIFFLSSGIMDCICLIWKKSTAYALGTSVVKHL